MGVLHQHTPILLLLLLLLSPTPIQSSFLPLHTRPTSFLPLSSSTTPIPPPPPISVPVYSLASPLPPNTTTEEKSTSMNIITFASPVSVEPPKLWMLSLYHNTLTKNTFTKQTKGILQVLTPSQKTLIPSLGKRSGYEDGYSKRQSCKELGFDWSRCDGDGRGFPSFAVDLIPNCAIYIELKLMSVHSAGDHELAICQVMNIGRWDEETGRVVVSSSSSLKPMDETDVLYTGLLRREGII